MPKNPESPEPKRSASFETLRAAIAEPITRETIDQYRSVPAVMRLAAARAARAGRAAHARHVLGELRVGSVQAA